MTFNIFCWIDPPTFLKHDRIYSKKSCLASKFEKFFHEIHLLFLSLKYCYRYSVNYLQSCCYIAIKKGYIHFLERSRR